MVTGVIVGVVIGVVITLIGVGIYCVSNLGFNTDIDIDLGSGGKMR